MNLRKFISGVSALAIAASAFVSMAVTASAADTDQSRAWTLSTATDTYDAFSNPEGGTGEYTGTSGRWTIQRGQYDSGALKVTYNRYAYYTNSDPDSPYYFTYKVRSYDDNSYVKLAAGTTAIGNEIVSGAKIKGTTYNFTTVVDAANNTAYTYDSNGALYATTTIPEGTTVTGIYFGRNNNDSSSIYVYNLSYGTATAKPALEFEAKNDIKYYAEDGNEVEYANRGNAIVTATVLDVTVNKTVQGITVTQYGENNSVYNSADIGTTFAAGTPITIGVIVEGGRDRTFFTSNIGIAEKVSVD